MKRIFFFCVVVVFVATSCAGVQTVRPRWKGTDSLLVTEKTAIPKSRPDKIKDASKLRQTELRLVYHPGQHHIIRDSQGQLTVTDWWYEEVAIEREPSGFFQPPSGEEGKRIEVDVRGKDFYGYWFCRFAIRAGESKSVKLESRWGKKELDAFFDGYLLDLGVGKKARLEPGLKHEWQELGEGYDLDEINVRLRW